MDVDRFDDLIRALIGRRSRRRLAATAAALIGGLLARARFDGAADTLANNKNKKGKGKKKKKKPAPCRAGECCTNNKPGCPAGLKCCGENCIDESLCCEDGAAKVPDCGQTCCTPEEECCEGECHNLLLLPLTCDACQDKKCVSGQGFECVEVTPGTPCGNNCCPQGQECCGESHCYDPEFQCCAHGTHVGEPCVGACCATGAPYKQNCCTNQIGARVCWARLGDCLTCQYQCGATCCDTDTECCFASGAKPDRCVNVGEGCSA